MTKHRDEKFGNSRKNTKNFGKPKTAKKFPKIKIKKLKTTKISRKKPKISGNREKKNSQNVSKNQEKNAKNIEKI